jgi:hypothetical protein
MGAGRLLILILHGLLQAEAAPDGRRDADVGASAGEPERVAPAE